MTFRYESFDIGTDPSTNSQIAETINSVEIPICFGWKKIPKAKVGKGTYRLKYGVIRR